MLYDKLKKEDRIPFHMPGHKRNTKLLGSKLPYDIDLTEIEGFDNLHSPEDIIKEIEEKAKKIYKSDNSFILVNGSTVGILAGVFAAVKRGDTVLMARNCHKSVYNAVELAGAQAEYILPETDKYGIFKAIDISSLEKKIKSVKPKLIVVTSPTYEGIMSEISDICEVAHKNGVPVLLDAAHETSSPSYILMCSVDECLSFKPDNMRLRNERKKLLNNCDGLERLRVIDYGEQTKLVVFTGYSNISGIELAEILRTEYKIEVEMAVRYYVVLVLTACDD